jgi:hypothetical protein
MIVPGGHFIIFIISSAISLARTKSLLFNGICFPAETIGGSSKSFSVLAVRRYGTVALLARMPHQE